MSEYVRVGGVDVRVGPLVAQLYLQEGERMPENAPDEWFEPRTENSDRFRAPVITFLHGMSRLVDVLRTLDAGTPEEDIQYHFYEVAKASFGEDRRAIREFFRLGYLFIMWSYSGPRWGQFVAIQGISEFIALVEDRLSQPLIIPLDNP
jgi:lysyl-tRNA synthetase class I